jgi:hypothetical protein
MSVDIQYGEQGQEYDCPDCHDIWSEVPPDVYRAEHQQAFPELYEERFDELER